MADLETDQDRVEPTAASPSGRRRLRGLVVLAGRITLAALLLGFCAGFVVFANGVSGADPEPPPRAEGIVVLTGGSDRIADAMALLAEGKAGRLLITGVARKTTIPEIADRYPDYKSLFRCCVDLGREAMNTVGNALETRQWVERQDIRHSLIIVTSAYHMPRAMAEMRARMPKLTLYPFAVVPDRMRRDPWWRDLDAVRLIGREYLKFLVVRARLALWDPPAAAPSSAPPADAKSVSL